MSLGRRRLVAFGVAALTLLGSLLVFGTLGAPPGPAAPPVSAAAFPSSLLQQAVSSLSHGSGPALGHSVSCTVGSATRASCGSGPVRAPTSPTASGASGSARVPSVGSAAHPHVLPSTLAWYNQTGIIQFDSGFNYGQGTPTVLWGSTMAYDPLLGEVVLFDGCSATLCLDSETWTYGIAGWQNLTGTLSAMPSVRDYPGMDYDPVLGGVVLVSGFGISGAAINDTWLFTGTWTNLTASNAAYGIPYPQAAGGVAWDPQLGGLILVDGCVDSGCSNAWTYTQLLLMGSGWSVYTTGPGYGSGTWLAFGNMVWDPVDQYTVWFGGYDVLSHIVHNYTYTFTALGGWVNISASDAGCFLVCDLTPAGRGWAAMTWDAQAGVVLLTGGYNDSPAAYYNDSWVFLGGSWLPAAFVSPTPPATFQGVYSPVMAVNSSGTTPFLLGGDCAASAACSPSMWVFEAPPAPFIRSESPNPADNGSTVSLTASFAAGSGSGPSEYFYLYYGDGGYSYLPTTGATNPAFNVTGTHAYTSTGTFSTEVDEYDFFLVYAANNSTSLSVNASLVASLTPGGTTTIDPGQSVTFTASVHNGTTPYNYTWSFGAGSAATYGGSSHSHTFATAGTYTVRLNLTDAGGGVLHFSRTVVVNPAVGAAFTYSPSAPSSGANVTFTGTASGGSGTYTYAWRFGDGTGASGQAATHKFASSGAYSVTLWVNDTLGGSSVKTLTVTVSAPSSSSNGILGGNGTLVLVLVVVVIAVVAAVAILAMRRRRGPQGATPPTAWNPPASMPPSPPPGAGGPPPGAVGPPPSS